MAKSPAFQFYVQDFLSGVKFFSAEETGAYILLLCEQWDSGFIENNDKILRKITGISSKKLQKVVEKFEIIDNKLINKRLDEEKSKRLLFIDRASEGGKESARLRAEEKSRSLEIKHPLKSKSSSSSSSSKKEKYIKKSFSDSEIFDKTTFCKIFSEWTKEKMRYYFDAAERYSNEGNKYIDWTASIRNWAKKDELQGKIKFSVNRNNNDTDGLL